MQVLMLGWDFPARLSGGLGTACRGLTQALCAGGTDVLYVRPRSARTSGPAGATVLESEHVPVLSTRGWRESGVREMLDVPANVDPYRGRSLSAHARDHDFLAEVERYTRAVGEIARVKEFDVIHAHDWMSIAAGLYAKELSGKPLLAHFHSTEFDREPLTPDPNIVAIERAGLQGCDQVVCVSESARRAVVERYGVMPERIRVLHNGVDAAEEFTREQPQDQGSQVLFLGRVTAQKDPATFLRAAARIHARLPEVRFVVAGDGDLLPSMVGLARELGLGSALRFTGTLNEDEVHRMYLQADVFVMPSRSEPFGLVSLEAMAHGVPVVATRGAGVLETLSSALVVEPGDAHALAECVVALLTRPALRAEMVRRGQHEVARASWSARSLELEGLYGELVS